MAEERIQKLLAQAGLGSRRACEEFLIGHRVTVNGKLVELGAKADPNKDVIKVDGKRIEIEQERIYVMLNKPAGIVTLAGSRLYTSAADTDEVIDDALARFGRVLAQADVSAKGAKA